MKTREQKMQQRAEQFVQAARELHETGTEWLYPDEGQLEIQLEAPVLQADGHPQRSLVRLVTPPAADENLVVSN